MSAFGNGNGSVATGFLDIDGERVIVMRIGGEAAKITVVVSAADARRISGHLVSLADELDGLVKPDSHGMLPDGRPVDDAGL